MNKGQLEQLQKIELFSFLGAKELEDIAPRITLREFAKNEVILSEEDANFYMYAVIRGKVRVFQTAEDGKEAVLAIHGEGNFFGELSLVDGKTSPATVAATEETVVALISKKDFDALLKHQQFLEGLLKSFCDRLRDSWRRIQMLGMKNAEERVRTLLYLLSEEHSAVRDPDGITLGVRLTHQNIADMSGLTRETVTRVMDKWIKKGEVTLDGNRRIRLEKGFCEKNFNL
jgi:CRP/FNR family transcriptional regulator